MAVATTLCDLQAFGSSGQKQKKTPRVRLLLHAAVVSFDIRKIFGWSSLWNETWCCGFEMKREPWHSYVFENQLQEVNHLLATFRPCRDNSYRFEVSWKPQDLHETVWKLQTHIMNHHICFRYETVSLARLPVSPKGYLRSLDLVTSKNASKDSLTWVIVFWSTGYCANVHETVQNVYTNMMKHHTDFVFAHETFPVASLQCLQKAI